MFVGSVLWGAITLQSSMADAFETDDAQLLKRVADHVASALRTAELSRTLEQTYLGTAAALAAALEAKDLYTADHARLIADRAVELGRALQLDDGELRDLRYGALFHDIGKIAIPDAILNKPGALDEAEMSDPRNPLVGERILAPVAFLSGIRRIVRHDHERWDGAGYPDGLRGDEIPLGARIVFVVDAFHAMTSDRPYRKAMTCNSARQELRRHAGTQFDPHVVRALFGTLDAEDSASASARATVPPRVQTDTSSRLIRVVASPTAAGPTSDPAARLPGRAVPHYLGVVDRCPCHAAPRRSQGVRGRPRDSPSQGMPTASPTNVPRRGPGNHQSMHHRGPGAADVGPP